MNITPVKTPLVAKKIFPNYVWDISTHRKELYLTFDDGPTPEITNWTLNTLKEFDAKATFFCIGTNIAKHPDIFQNIIKDHHAIGNHTQHHVKGWKTKTETYVAEVLETEKQIQLQQPEPSYLFRPPYGQIKPKQGKQLMALGYQIIMWDVLSFDWQKEFSGDECVDNVISKSKNGSIIVFHDSIKASKNMMYALPKVLDFFSKAGFKFKALRF
ncbi:polysaccharide deacetylase family protein [Psychroserpens mesophilus]|uniref:polysaccharide deacetylase family protein n=1 Tax=Psychroserpens mesophilus TaxID=325473 RepID=UPI003D6550A6